jgi:hypothetical protein
MDRQSKVGGISHIHWSSFNLPCQSLVMRLEVCSDKFILSKSGKPEAAGMGSHGRRYA